MAAPRERAFVLGTGGQRLQQWGYVALSRAREQTSVYVTSVPRERQSHSHDLDDRDPVTGSCKHSKSPRSNASPRALREARAVAAGPVERALGPAVEALLLAARGELEQAEGLACASVAAAETETDNPWLQGWAYEDLATVLERAGRIAEAREALERALAVWEQKRCLPYAGRIPRADRLARAGKGLTTISPTAHCSGCIDVPW